jgi:hypothetical protein
MICGHSLPRQPHRPLRECIQEGRKMLAELAGVDYGYDLQRWHDHLKHTRDGGYTWNRTIALPRIMAEALASEEWRAIVEELADAAERG